MKRLLIVVLLLFRVVAFSQQNRFIYIQAGPQQPFYVRMGERSFSSSAFGHLVIPKIGDSTYKLYIGFPRNQLPEQEFSVTVNGKDRGFDLRVENSNQLMLFDWQKAELLRSTNPPAPTQEISYKIKRRTDPYAILMAGVVNDSLVLVSMQELQQPLVKSDPALSIIDSNSKETGRQLNSKDSVVAINTVSGVDSITRNTSASRNDSITTNTSASANQPETGRKDSVAIDVTSRITENNNKLPSMVTVRLLSEETGPEKKQLIFIDGAGAKSDTINVVILKEFETIIDSPAANHISKDNVMAAVKEDVTIKDSSINQLNRDAIVVEIKERDTVIIVSDTIKNSNLLADTIITTKEPLYRPGDTVQTEKDTTAGSIVLINSDCSRFASDLDVDKLRVLLIKEKEDDDRTFIAKKVFRTKCFTTKQIKGLTELFSGEASKYMFLDAAYPFVSDSGNFKNLISLFSDPYYINRFKALVRM